MKAITKTVLVASASVSLAAGMAGIAAARPLTVRDTNWNHHRNTSNLTVTSTQQRGVFGNGSAIIKDSNEQSNANSTAQNSTSSTVAPVTQTALGGVNNSQSGTNASSGTTQLQLQLPSMNGGDGLTELTPLHNNDGGNSNAAPSQSQNSSSTNTAATVTMQSSTVSNSNTSSASTTTTQNNTSSQGNSNNLTFSPSL